MGDGMESFNAGMRAYTGAPDPKKKKKDDDEEGPSQAAQMLSDAASGISDMASTAADYIMGKKKKD